MFKKLDIIFAGTPEFGVYHLEALLTSGYNIVSVFTRPDKYVGRGKKLMSSPVKMFASKKGLPVFQPTSFYAQETQKLISDLNADVMVVVAYGVILPKSVLSIPRLGCINVHGSLLPRWRGTAPIQRALLAGDKETGVTIIQMNAGLDTGDILYKTSCPISDEDTSATLYANLATLGTKGLLKTLQQLEEETMVAKVQDKSLVTYAKKLTKEEGRVDWSLSAVQLERCIRAFNPWPMSWFMIKEQPVKIWKGEVIHTKLNVKPGTLLETNKNGIQVATADGILNLKYLQPSGRKVMSAQDFLNSRQKWFKPGMCLD